MQRIAAIYTRQSLDKKDSLSIETQIEDCKRMLAKDERYAVYTDKGFTGANTKRPGFQQLMEDVRNGKIGKIVVYKLDRFSRNVVDFVDTYDVLKEKNVDFISVNERFDTSGAAGQMMQLVIMSFAQMERANIQQRVKDNYYFRVLDGRWAGGPAPYGFILGKIGKKVPTLVQNPNEIDAVKYVFHEYAYSPTCSLGTLGKELYNMGYRSRRKGGTFDNVTISRIIQNPVYAIADERLKKYYELRGIKFLNIDNDGKPEPWSGKSSCHIIGKDPNNSNVRKYKDLKQQSIYLTNFEGIVDSKTFILAQDRLAQNEQIAGSNKPSNMKDLTGLVKCKKCGYAVKMYSKPYLACYGRYGLKTCEASFRGFKLEDIQTVVSEEIQKVLNTMVQDMLQRQHEQRQIREQIESKKEQQEKLLDLYLQNEDISVIKERMEKLQKEIVELELNVLMDIKLSERMKISSALPLKYERLSDEEKIMVSHFLIDKILLSEDGTIDIVWKV